MALSEQKEEVRMFQNQFASGAFEEVASAWVWAWPIEEVAGATGAGLIEEVSEVTGAWLIEEVSEVAGAWLIEEVS